MKIAAVVVTFRRRRLLLECLGGLLRQTRELDNILVVDNAGEPELPELLSRDFGPNVTCLPLPENRGSAGGYAAGVEWAWRSNFDWAWLMDDDCEPLSDAMEQLQRALARLPAPPAALVSCHLSPRGQPVGTAAGHFDWNRCRLILLSAEGCDRGIRPVDTVSSSGMFLNLRSVNRVGIPDGRLFYLEDPDFSRRLARYGPLFHVGGSRILRKLSDQDWLAKRRGYWRAPVESFWRAYYSFRNNVHFYFGARPGAGTLALWSYRYLHALAGILLLDDYKWWRAKLMTGAFWDGLHGHLGKTLDPEQMVAHITAQGSPRQPVPGSPDPVGEPQLALCSKLRGV